LVRAHQAGVRAYVRTLGVNEAWVDDLAQETFLVAYRKLEECDPERDAGKWLRGIARNLAANERRKAGRRSRLLAHGLADLLIEQANPDEGNLAAGWLDAMRACLQELPEQARGLLLKRYVDGELAEALAAQSQIRADALRQKLLRLRMLVRRCIEGKMGELWS